MRRLAALCAAVALLAGCQAAAPPPTAPVIAAEVHPAPGRKLISAEGSVRVGTFADDAHGWVVEGLDRLLVTTDGGRHWTHQATFDQHVYGLHFLSKDRGWAYTGTGTLETRDGGGTWLPVPAERSPRGGRFLDERFGWALEQQDGNSPSFLRLTPDGGASWTTQPTPCRLGFQAHSASFVDPQTGFLLCGFFQGSGGSSKWLYGTSDGGQSWELLTGTIYGQVQPEFPAGVRVEPGRPAPDGALPTLSSMGGLDFLDAAHGSVIFGTLGPYPGQVYTTADGGRTWKRLALPAGLVAAGARFFTPSFGRVLVHDQHHWGWLQTRDGGATWQSAVGD